MITPVYGVNRRNLDRLFLSLGGTIEDVRRTGELRYRHPLMDACAKANKRRKDAPSHLVDFVRELIRRFPDPTDRQRAA